MSCAAPVDVDTPGEYSSGKEFCMTTNRIGTITLAIDGMSCGHCVTAVTKVLSTVAGVKVQSVALGSAVIEAADGLAASQAMAALGEAGYSATAPGDVAVTSARRPAWGGAGCCSGAKNVMQRGTPGADASGGCCR